MRFWNGGDWTVWLVDARQLKYVPGRKSDVQDCQWLQKLMSLGLLRAAWRPGDAVCVVRAVVRQREMLLTEQASWVQRMQKALVQMNIQLTEVLTDVMGSTGQGIIRDIVAGERDPAVLARHRQGRVKASVTEVQRALAGNWRDEHLFVLTQALAMYDSLAQRVAECDAKLQALLIVIGTRNLTQAGILILIHLVRDFPPSTPARGEAVITWERCMEIGILRRQGRSLRAIARETGLAVNTVRKHLAEEGPPRYGPRPPRPSKLDVFKPYLIERVEAARPHWIPATVLAREIRERGYEGCERLVSRFVRSMKPVAKDDPVVRFETEPGRQMQVDWIEFKRERLSAFVATLGYSRCAYVHYVTDERIDTLVACHVLAFEYFGGVVREVLYDNVKTVVIARDEYGPGLHRFHGTLWDVARHYNFQPRLCRPLPGQDQGQGGALQRLPAPQLPRTAAHPAAPGRHPTRSRDRQRRGAALVARGGQRAGSR